MIVDPESYEFEAVENTGARMQWITRGTATGKLVAGHNVDAVIAGHIGRKATKILKEAHVSIYTGAKGTVKQAVEALNEGKLEEIWTACFSFSYATKLHQFFFPYTQRETQGQRFLFPLF